MCILREKYKEEECLEKIKFKVTEKFIILKMPNETN